MLQTRDTWLGGHAHQAVKRKRNRILNTTNEECKFLLVGQREVRLRGIRVTEMRVALGEKGKAKRGARRKKI